MPGRRSRPDLFPRDRGLEAAMALALLVYAVLVAGILALIVWVVSEDAQLGLSLLFFVACFAIVGAAAPSERRRRSRRSRSTAPGEAARVEGIVERLCLMADLERPQVQVVADELPLTWTAALPLRDAKLFVTTGLLDRVSDGELAAVVAHELSHLANGDALLMTVVAGPPVWVLRGVRQMWRDRWEDWRNLLAVIMYGSYSAPVALVLAGAARVVSRRRELAADRGAALLTASPSALAAALLRLSGELESQPLADLRAVAPRDPFHLLPARPPRGLRRLWATHPPLEARLAQLERLEAALQGGR